MELLKQFNYAEELKKLPMEPNEALKYYFHNFSFKSGDSEYLYNMIRHFKPSKIIEVGSGYSTLMAIEALKKNKELDANYDCEHICIEPYENKWLEELNCEVIREIVEEVDMSIFLSLQKNDILFIDSSHMIRPQGDVLKECLEIIPLLKPSVFVHIHDIFTPSSSSSKGRCSCYK